MGRSACRLGVFMVVLAILPSCAQGPQFEVTARQAINAIAAGDMRRFSRVAAEEVVVARREADLDHSGILKGPSLPPRGVDSELFLGGNLGAGWQEIDVTFTQAEMDSEKFGRVLQQFRAFAWVTSRHYGGGTYSLNMKDPMGSQQHVPGFQGKLASDTFWYVYFVRQGKEWRMSRLEWARD